MLEKLKTIIKWIFYGCIVICVGIALLPICALALYLIIPWLLATGFNNLYYYFIYHTSRHKDFLWSYTVYCNNEEFHYLGYYLGFSPPGCFILALWPVTYPCFVICFVPKYLWMLFDYYIFLPLWFRLKKQLAILPPFSLFYAFRHVAGGRSIVITVDDESRNTMIFR